eukprot:gene27232-biopygen7582
MGVSFIEGWGGTKSNAIKGLLDDLGDEEPVCKQSKVEKDTKVWSVARGFGHPGCRAARDGVGRMSVSNGTSLNDKGIVSEGT